MGKEVEIKFRSMREFDSLEVVHFLSVLIFSFMSGLLSVSISFMFFLYRARCSVKLYFLLSMQGKRQLGPEEYQRQTLMIFSRPGVVGAVLQTAL